VTVSVLYVVVGLKCYVRHSPASSSLLTESKLSMVVSISTKRAHVLATHSSNSRLLLRRWGWVWQVFGLDLWVCSQQCLPLTLHLHSAPSRNMTWPHHYSNAAKLTVNFGCWSPAKYVLTSVARLMLKWFILSIYSSWWALSTPVMLLVFLQKKKTAVSIYQQIPWQRLY